MKIEMTNRELIDFYDAMKQIGETEKNNKWFTYAVTLNEENLKSKVVAFLKCAKPSDEYKSYEATREKLIHKYAECDEHGNIVVDNTSKLIKIQDKYVNEAMEEFNKLDKANIDILSQRNEELAEYKLLSDKKIKIDVEQVALEHFPNNINKIMMKALKPLIAIKE